LQSARERAHEFSLGFAFRFAGAPFWGAAQAFEQGLRGAAPAVAVLGEEAGQALGPEARGRFGRRIALEEGERDRAGEIAEDAAAPDQKLSSRAVSWLARATRVPTRSSRPRTRPRRALMASDWGASGRRRWPSVRRMSARMKASPGSLLAATAR
jgi:hypothetical protein